MKSAPGKVLGSESTRKPGESRAVISSPAPGWGAPCLGPRRKIGEVEGRIVAIADCLGDWREEVITALDGEIRIYSTTVPATSRRACLMQDRHYRTDAAAQTMGSFHPPQLGGTPLPPGGH